MYSCLMKSDKPLESQIQKEVLAFLKWSRLVHWRQNLGGIQQNVAGNVIFKKNPLAGFPDIAGLCPNGRLWAMEIKRRGERPTEKQEAWHRDLAASNALVFVIHSVAEAIIAVQKIKSQTLV